MNIVVITGDPFPIGMAPTNRVISYCKGLIELGHNISVHITRPTEPRNNIINSSITGTYNSIFYKYYPRTTIWPNNYIKRLFLISKGITLSAIDILRYKNLDCVISNNTLFLPNLMFFFITRIKKVPFIRAEDEYPPMIYQTYKKHNKFWTFIYLKSYYKFFEGMMLISQKLIEYYKPLMRKKSNQLLLPINVEPDRFNKKVYFNEKNPYIAYCGYMGRKKDGVDILINAFNIFHENNPKFKLYLIGYTNDITEEKELKQLISILKLNTAIVLTGKVKRDDMPKFLTNATILALARPESKQAEAGFPTKLGEYLATGNPVVVTSVGEIENYLTHGVNAFICKPGNIRDFAEKLDFIAKNQSFAKKVGIEGRKLAETVFNYKKQAINIITFINKIKNNE